MGPLTAPAHPRVGQGRLCPHPQFLGIRVALHIARLALLGQQVDMPAIPGDLLSGKVVCVVVSVCRCPCVRFVVLSIVSSVRSSLVLPCCRLVRLSLARWPTARFDEACAAAACDPLPLGAQCPEAWIGRSLATASFLEPCTPRPGRNAHFGAHTSPPQVGYFFGRVQIGRSLALGFRSRYTAHGPTTPTQGKSL